MSALRVVPNVGRPGGRLYVCGHRCHHGAAGAALLATGLIVGGPAGAAAVALGAAAMWHDRHDLRRTWWLLDA